MGNEEVENGIDVVNEVMLEQENLVKADEMDTDENNPSLKEGVVTNEGEEEFQDVTDEETDGNQGPVQGTSKMRMVHSLISPRKRIQSKTTSKQGEGTKLGDGTKHGAEQGTSNPKPPINKLKILMDYKHEEGRWKHRELFVFGIKLEVAEYKHYIFLWSAWDDTSGSMTSLSQSIWLVNEL
ncbi:hypothetical protein Bca52824_096277 [Brassica carinata]|uniref:Uncharacterized protein n=1 Tax=Brassica carinata TaxID=52824 RepID=A0A8X7NZS3_BRACI|nr:hypothetical protein Bca52824_096277 [Brassica carinata]